MSALGDDDEGPDAAMYYVALENFAPEGEGELALERGDVVRTIAESPCASDEEDDSGMLEGWVRVELTREPWECGYVPRDWLQPLGMQEALRIIHPSEAQVQERIWEGARAAAEGERRLLAPVEEEGHEAGTIGQMGGLENNPNRETLQSAPPSLDLLSAAALEASLAQLASFRPADHASPMSRSPMSDGPDTRPAASASASAPSPSHSAYAAPFDLPPPPPPAPKPPVSRYDLYPSTTAVRRLLADLRHNRPALAPLAPAIRFADYEEVERRQDQYFKSLTAQRAEASALLTQALDELAKRMDGGVARTEGLHDKMVELDDTISEERVRWRRELHRDLSTRTWPEEAHTEAVDSPQEQYSPPTACETDTLRVSSVTASQSLRHGS